MHEGNIVYLLPLGRELNGDKIVFSTYAGAEKYCDVTADELLHLNGTCASLNRLCYKVGRPIARTATGIAAPGILLFRLRPGQELIIPKLPICARQTELKRIENDESDVTVLYNRIEDSIEQGASMPDVARGNQEGFAFSVRVKGDGKVEKAKWKEKGLL